ncbi:sensory histidine kinase in two-component regulatory system with cpxr [Pseudomonas amygdali pv. mori str. 301020]|uniref:histidine kinase n=1 Tax=Pseudomonas amygdali pv. mori str. 301020 TaxID=629261 RepID=A0A656GG22_PSEA0|nr:sensory histidine kinase in two-component regulatory system with cpxr [Pseudomonas amygdali pv. mori str. 301020]
MRARTGRLFWKLSLALFLSMALAMLGTYAYITLTNRSIPLPPEDIARIGPIPIIPVMSGLCAILVMGLVLAWYLTRPLQRLTWALRRIADGHFDTRVTPLMQGQRDEIADLAHEFDRMAEQLQNALESQKALFHDISHELRSPLTRMQAAIGLTRQDPEATLAMLDRIELESNRLDSMIDELLSLHRIEAKIMPTMLDRIDLIELLRLIIEDANFEAKGTGREVVLEASETFIACVHGELIYRAFENVIRNAIKYGPRGKTIKVRAKVDTDQQLEVVVSDRGPGVPQHQLDDIFKPFYRIEGEESGRGTGLGLAIAQRSLVLHRGHICAYNREAGGLEVKMNIPSSDNPLE